MKLTLWPEAHPIRFHLVAGGKEYACHKVKYTYVHLLQSQNGILFTLDGLDRLRIVAGTSLDWLDSLEDGERLRFLRNQFGISQKELADMYHVHQTAVANWENGYKHIPPQRKQQIKETLYDSFVMAETMDGLAVEKEEEK